MEMDMDMADLDQINMNIWKMDVGMADLDQVE